MTKDQLVRKLDQKVKGLSKYLDKIDYENALQDAERETGWAIPITDDFKLYWIQNRAIRHLYSYLLSESAHKFKYEQINLQQRYEHYRQLVKDSDLAFTEIQESRPEMFAGVEAFKMFTTKIDAGFHYDSIGNDTTYDNSNEVVFTPTEDD